MPQDTFDLESPHFWCWFVFQWILTVFVCSDFAARNCLVMGDNTVKLGDYGLTRQIFKARRRQFEHRISSCHTLHIHSPPYPSRSSSLLHLLTLHPLTGGLLFSWSQPAGMAHSLDGSRTDCDTGEERPQIHASLHGWKHLVRSSVLL